MTLANKSSLFVIFILAKDVVSIQTCPDKWKGWGTSCYLFVTSACSGNDDALQKSNWSMARAYCLKRGADLVSLTSDDEVDFVRNHTKNLVYWFWIGLKYNKTKLRKYAHWAWSNGDKLNITKWSAGEPNNLNRKRCVVILILSTFWLNVGCHIGNWAWICEKPKVKTSMKTVTKIQSTVVPVVMTSKESIEEDTRPTKDQSSDTKSSTMSISMVLYIFPPMILFALIIVIILLVRKNKASNENESPREDNNREMEYHQENDNHTLAESDRYAELHRNREPDNTYSSLNLYENSDNDPGPSYVNSGRSYVIGNNVNYINQEVQRRSSHVIPPA